MLRRTSFACVLALAACQEPQPRKQVDPDLWDPRHEALINQDEPPERREPEYTRASRSGAASATLSEAAREHREGATELEKAEAAQERAAARQSAREQELHSRELRWVDRERAEDARSAQLAELSLRASLLEGRLLGVLLEQALAHCAAPRDGRRAIRFAEARAEDLAEAAASRRAQARRARADAELQRRLHEAGSGGAQSALRAERAADADQRNALCAEEAALRAAEAARRCRLGYLGG